MTKKKKNPLDKRSTDRRGLCRLKTGEWSEKVKAIQQRLDILPLTDVQKMEFKNMLEEGTAKSLAFDMDRLFKEMIIESMDGTNSRVLSYQADMVDTQTKLAEREKDLQFHKKVLADLKEKYTQTEDTGTQIALLEQIDLREDQIRKIQTLYNQLLDLRNKMRKELDKKTYQEKSLKIQEEDHESKIREREKIVINMDELK